MEYPNGIRYNQTMNENEWVKKTTEELTNEIFNIKVSEKNVKTKTPKLTKKSGK